MDTEAEFHYALDKTEGEIADNNEEQDGNSDDDGYDSRGSSYVSEEHDENLRPWPFIAAAAGGNLTTVRSLLQQGVNVDQTTKRGSTALMHAASIAMMQLLLENGADINKASHDGNTPLSWACMGSNIEEARYLLEQGADRDKADSIGLTPLHSVAAQYARIDYRGGPDITTPDQRRAEVEIAKLLMVDSADLNAREHNGRLPIYYARTEEMKQAIRDEPRRRMDHGHKRATEQDRHPDAATSGSAQQEEQEKDELSNKRSRLDKGEAEEGKDSEPSDGENDD